MKIRIASLLLACTALLSAVASQFAQAQMMSNSTPMQGSMQGGMNNGMNNDLPSMQQRMIDLTMNPPVKAPTVTVKPLLLASATSVSLHGIISANQAPTKYWIACGTSKKSLIAASNKADVPSGTVSVTATLNGLKPKTTYYFQIYASNSEGTTASMIQKITTGEAETATAIQTPANAPAVTASMAK